MSLRILSNYLSLTPSQIESIEKEIKQFIANEPLTVDNKKIASLFKSLVKKHISSFSLQQGYEVLSMVSGFRNYNVALSKNVNFKNLFIKYPIITNSSNEEIPSLTIKRNWKIPAVSKIQGEICNYLPTGIIFIDSLLGGGMLRNKVCLNFSSSLFESSLFAVSIGSNSIRVGFKVLHINIGGANSDVFNKYYANLTESKYSLNQIKDAKQISKISNRLLIQDYSNSVRFSEIKKFCQETYKTFRFDQLIIEGIESLLNYSPNLSINSLGLARIYKQVIELTKEYNCSSLTTLISNNSQYTHFSKPYIQSIGRGIDIDVLNNIPSTIKNKNDVFIISVDKIKGYSVKNIISLNVENSKTVQIGNEVNSIYDNFNLISSKGKGKTLVVVDPPYEQPIKPAVIIINPPYNKGDK